MGMIFGVCFAFLALKGLFWCAFDRGLHSDVGDNVDCFGAFSLCCVVVKTCFSHTHGFLFEL